MSIDELLDLARDMTAEMLAVRDAALADAARLRVIRERLGVPDKVEVAAPRRERKPSSRKGKTAPTLEGWLSMALEDGALPQPTPHLHIAARIVQRALEAGLIEGEGHPYRLRR